MASLYEIDKSILECVDPETGEIFDPERLENLFMDRQKKIENIALWVKNLESDAKAFKAEKEAFADREKKALAKAEQLKKYLARVLVGEKFSTGKCAVSFRRSERVEVFDDALVPKKYLTKKVTFAPDKNAIKDRLKGGHKVGGCRLLENLNAQIK